MKAQQGEIHMCANYNKELCGNLEVRGVLVNKLEYLGKDRPKDANARIRKCADLVENQCLDTYGQLFHWYRQVVHEACGLRDSGWSNTSIVTTRYYNPITFTIQRGAIAHASYATFLCVIVTIWLLVVFNEARQILSWWIVLLFYPTPNRESSKTIEMDEDSLDVLAIPNTYKVLQILFNLTPRTLICCGLAYYGCDFLIFADDYGELILNSVALGFLIDIDNMIFRGVISEKHQSNVSNCRPMEVQFNCNKILVRCFNIMPQALTSMGLIIAISVTKIYTSYHDPKGKLDMASAYTCLCHSEGEQCVAAQVLGGLFSLPLGAFHGGREDSSFSLEGALRGVR
mmetsp:Transcript_64308/g.101988  ORF Transcript_64308/g.101988 Transcript_64308/m.101988 type:complete len:343 (+) Transcript_64308:3-1031(+)